jgi:hypothetical protein
LHRQRTTRDQLCDQHCRRREERHFFERYAKGRAALSADLYRDAAGQDVRRANRPDAVVGSNEPEQGELRKLNRRLRRLASLPLETYSL